MSLVQQMASLQISNIIWFCRATRCDYCG